MRRVVFIRTKNEEDMAAILNRLVSRTAILSGPLKDSAGWIVWLMTEDKNLKSGEV